MKKLLFPLIFTLVFCLNGCISPNPKYINFTTKPNNHYYTDELRNKILNNESFSLCVFDTDLYKEIIVDKDESLVIENFLNSLTTDNYLSSNEKPDTKEPFRIKVTFGNDKYLIKVYDSSTISISPWDGNYEEDIVSMENVPLRYNLMDFCNHIQNKPISKN